MVQCVTCMESFHITAVLEGSAFGRTKIRTTKEQNKISGYTEPSELGIIFRVKHKQIKFEYAIIFVLSPIIVSLLVIYAHLSFCPTPSLRSLYDYHGDSYVWLIV